MTGLFIVLAPSGIGLLLLAFFRRFQLRLDPRFGIAALASFVFYLFVTNPLDRYVLTACTIAMLGIRQDGPELKIRSYILLALVLACLTLAFQWNRLHETWGYRVPQSDYKALVRNLPDKTVVLCDEDSGAIRRYTGLYTLRYRWAPAKLVDEVVDILKKKGYTVVMQVSIPAYEAEARVLAKRLNLNMLGRVEGAGKR